MGIARGKGTVTGKRRSRGTGRGRDKGRDRGTNLNPSHNHNHNLGPNLSSKYGLMYEKRGSMINRRPTTTISSAYYSACACAS